MATFGRFSVSSALCHALDAREVTQAYRQYAHELRRRCRYILRSEPAAEDAVQEVFTRLWRYGHSFRDAQCKLSWLYRVADRCCFNELKRRRTRREVPTHDSDDGAHHRPSSTLEDREVILRFLNRFDSRVQQVAVLHYVDEMTQVEIAEVTGWSRQTIHKKLLLLRERAAVLRERLLSVPVAPKAAFASSRRVRQVP
jgi:RNA polymerase sigma-70 factor, ECF subfamily